MRLLYSLSGRSRNPQLAETMIANRDTSLSVVDFVHRLLLRPEADHPDLPNLLRESAEIFCVGRACLANLPEGVCIAAYPETVAELPWTKDPALIDRARVAPSAIALENGRSALLALHTGEGGWLLWLHSDTGDAFRDSELAALTLFGQTLTRWFSSPTRPKWLSQMDRGIRQQKLEIAANITRRLAHDFGNVLTGILGFTELAQTQQVPPTAPLHGYLGEVYNAAQSGANFTQQLRLFSRRQATNSRPSRLHTILVEQEARLFAAQASGVNLRVFVPEDLPPVALDAESLHQVFSALLDNAREAICGQGAIAVTAQSVQLTQNDCLDLYGTTRPGPYVEVVIADTGIGLSPEVERKLFTEPFYTSKPRRRGFGLAMVYGILAAHRGGMLLHSGEERGVVVRVLLPIAAGTPTQPAPAVPIRAEKIKGERILVVDDEADVLQYVATTLERAGYRVQTAASGESALQCYLKEQADPFRMVLTDVAMPGMNGVELVRRLLNRDTQLRVLFMSGHVSTDFTQQDIGGQGIELLSKPFRTVHLLKSVRATIDKVVRRTRDGGVEVVGSANKIATGHK
jgi:signal transduction histidine kinase/ActR/RegA family two-component response regulator